MVLPGPEARQLATCTGWLMHRTWRGIVVGGLFVLPSLFILIALSWIHLRFGDMRWFSGAQMIDGLALGETTRGR
jgi:chromate transporter